MRNAMELVLGIDLGTSYFKLGLFDREGELRGLGRVPVEVETGDGSRSELPVERFWATLQIGLRKALDAADATPADIVAVSYSSQANSFLLLGEDGGPLTPLILWPDSRVETIDPAVRDLWSRGDFLAHTGLGILASPQLMIAKIRWFQQHAPDIWSRARRIMTISDYLTFALTGETVGDGGTAALLGILDVERCCWWEDALDAICITGDQLSTPLRPGSVAGAVTPDGAAALGIEAGIPFAVGSLDHHVAALGAGVGSIAPCSESTGTVLACVRFAVGYRPTRGICSGPGFAEGTFYQLAFSGNGGSVLEWYQREYASESTFPELDDLASVVASDCDGLTAKPLANSYEGLSGFDNASEWHTHGHFARAIMASTAGTLSDLVGALYPRTPPSGIVATGGGSNSDFWLQMKADALGIEVVRTTCSELACKGAATLAARGAGWGDDLNKTAETWTRTEQVYLPGQRGDAGTGD